MTCPARSLKRWSGLPRSRRTCCRNRRGAAPDLRFQSPKLATEGCVRDFGIKIHGRTIAVEHSETGHVYEYVWFREAPRLRLPLVRENEMATVPVAELVANAEKAAMLELENASLLNVAA